MQTHNLAAVLCAACLLGWAGCASTPVNLNRLSTADQDMTARVLSKLDPVIADRRSRGDAAALDFEDLYAPLDKSEQVFLKRFAGIDPAALQTAIPYRGICSSPPELLALEGQTLAAAGGTEQIPAQYLPKPVYEAYIKMAAAMKAELGKTVYVVSGYRSPAYQLYLFLFYLKNHDYSIAQTARFVAWPGYSEHGDPAHQAIDLINEQGIDGQDNPDEFEALEEYRWLLKNAGRYGFELSYPKGGKMAFEPWHWRFKDKK